MLLFPNKAAVLARYNKVVYCQNLNSPDRFIQHCWIITTSVVYEVTTLFSHIVYWYCYYIMFCSFMRDKDAPLLFCLMPAHRVLVCELLHSVILFTYELERHAVGAWVGRMRVRNSNSEYFSFLKEYSQAASKYSNPHIINSQQSVFNSVCQFLAPETLHSTVMHSLVDCYWNHQS